MTPIQPHSIRIHTTHSHTSNGVSLNGDCVKFNCKGYFIKKVKYEELLKSTRMSYMKLCKFSPILYRSSETSNCNA